MSVVLELAKLLAAPPRILIVEDEIGTIDILTRMLDRYDCKVVCEQTVEGAIKRIMAEKFDLAFVDIVFPAGSGVDVVRAIKTHRPEMPVVVMTGHPHNPLVDKACAYGVIAFMRKPVDFSPESIGSVLRSYKIRVRSKVAAEGVARRVVAQRPVPAPA